jgi:hypothetical protein
MVETRLIEGEARVHGPRPRQHQHNAGEWAARSSDLEGAEAAPVDLRLLAGERLQAQIRFRTGLRANGADVAPQWTIEPG